MADQAFDVPVDQLLDTPNLLTHQISGGSSENQSDASLQGLQQTSDPVRRKRGRPRKHPPRGSESETNVKEATRFIHVNQEGADHETRRAIRSHAMSAFRRDQREQRRALERAFDSITGMTSTSSLPQDAPMAKRPSITLTSFGKLPLTIDNATLELLIELFGSQEPVRLSQALEDQIQYFRKVDWLPMQQLKFVRSAQMAWVNIQSASPTQGSTTGASSHHLLRAFADINEAIESIDQMPVESLCYSVALCLSAASITRDFDAFEAHFHGFAALLAYQDTWNSNLEFLRIYLVRFGLVHFYPGTLTVEKLQRIQEPTPRIQHLFVPLSLPTFLQIHTSLLPDENLPNDQIYTTLQQDVMPIILNEATASIARLQILLEHTSNGEITNVVAEDLVRHIWLGSCMLYNAQPMCRTPLEKACRLSLMIHFYTQLFTAPSVLVDRLILSVLRQLRLLLLDMDQMLSQSSELIVWLVSTAGAFATGNARTQMSRRMKMLQYRLAYASDVSALGEVCRAFLWGHYTEGAAQKFWTDTASLADDDVGGRSDLLILDDFVEDDDDREEADLLETCELEATVLGLVPVGL